MGHSTILVAGDPSSLAVDPWRWRDEELKADVVLITHGHADHCSEDDIAAASHAETIVVAPEGLAPRLVNPFGSRVRGVAEGDVLVVGDARIRVLPAEGPPRAAGFHRRGDGVSYLVELDGSKYLFLGDSAALAEHEMLEPDVAFFAVGGLAVMDPEEAARAVARIRPVLAVPVHWGDLNGRFDLAARFVRACEALGVRGEAGAQSL